MAGGPRVGGGDGRDLHHCDRGLLVPRAGLHHQLTLESNFFVSVFWRRLVVHMFLEVTFVILFTVIVDCLFRQLGTFSRPEAV